MTPIHEIDLGDPVDPATEPAYVFALVVADIVAGECIPVSVAYGPDAIACAIQGCREGRSFGIIAISDGETPETAGYSLVARTQLLHELLLDVLKRAAVICRPEELLS